jgi:hypothetical protein
LFSAVETWAAAEQDDHQQNNNMLRPRPVNGTAAADDAKENKRP